MKGLKKNGICLGNWLTAEQGRSLWQAPDTDRVKGKRGRAMLVVQAGSPGCDRCAGPAAFVPGSFRKRPG